MFSDKSVAKLTFYIVFLIKFEIRMCIFIFELNDRLDLQAGK